MKKNISSDATLKKKLERIKLIITDVDGVLTAGEIIIPPSGGGDLKIWNVRDRLAFAMLRLAGSSFKLAFVTGRSSADVSSRASELGAVLYDNCADKRDAFNKITTSLSLAPDEVAALGDDIIDIPMLKLSGVAVCPSDAHPEVKKICDIVLKSAGGKGAFREFTEMLLKSRGLWHIIKAEYIDKK